MDIRNAENIILKNAIINVIDIENSELILSEKEMNLDDNEIRDFLYNIVLKTLKDDKNIKAKFDETTSISNLFYNAIDDDFFSATENLSKAYFDKVSSSNQSSVDLLFVKFNVGELPCLAMLILDYNMTYIHKVSVEDNELNVSIVRQDIALPTGSKKPKRAIFATKLPNDDLYLIVLDKLKTEETTNFLLSEFLKAEHKLDYMAKTRSVKNLVEDFTRKNLKDDFEDANSLRTSLEEAFYTRGVISPEEIIENAKLKKDIHSSSLKELIDAKGISLSEKFDIDKNFVKNKMVNKTIITDTGVTIKANRELFSLDECIELKYNGDGTVDYIIKNVKYTREK